MKLEKAIEVLQDHVEWCDPVKELDTYQALHLGIEALKVIRDVRPTEYEAIDEPLPSET